MVPINLKDLLGGRYRVVLDESARHEPGAKKDLWYFMLLCRYGSIYPFSARLLAFHCTARGIRTRLHGDHPRLEIRNLSDDGEAIFLFRLDQFDLVAEYARPRRKRRISGEERDRLAKIGRDHHFKPNSTAINATKTPQNGATSDDSTQTMAETEIGDSGGHRPHFIEGEAR